MIITDEKLVKTFLTRGVEQVYPSNDFVSSRLIAGKRLTIYLGIDPTGPTLHMGHMVVLRKLRQFQDLGHKVILLVGDFTAMVGDPTDKSALRKRLSRKDVIQNAKLYKSQASKILRFSGKNPAELMFNSRWLSKMTFADVLELSSHFTVQQMMHRDMFRRREVEGKEISILEFMYPLMQGYDSVAMKVDGEVGGNDQTFNMLAGRILMKEMIQKEKFVMTMKLLVDATGKKMGKTEGNMITFLDSAQELFGKVMSWTDGMIESGFELLTDVDLLEVKKRLKNENPRDVKMWLAEEVIMNFFDAEKAKEAKESFIATFQKHEIPMDIPEYKTNGEQTIIEVLLASKLATSKTEARRLLAEGAVKIDGEVVKALDVIVKSGVLIQKGKRYFVRIV